MYAAQQKNKFDYPWCRVNLSWVEILNTGILSDLYNVEIPVFTSLNTSFLVFIRNFLKLSPLYVQVSPTSQNNMVLFLCFPNGRSKLNYGYKVKKSDKVCESSKETGQQYPIAAQSDPAHAQDSETDIFLSVSNCEESA
ncbi:hypothetical protein TNCV_3916751 [Trichonephila clavipes]|nr:hypothetical protein TNCV_3916751 [Trichonephila clavipes]